MSVRTSLSFRTSSAATLCAALCLLSSACATPRPSLDGEGDAYVSRAGVLEPFSASKQSPAIKPLGEVSPWGDPAREPRQVRESNIMELGYRFYSNHLSKVDGPRCEHRPTCSRYARDAMRKHGSVKGSWLTIDRLLRAGNSSSLRQLPIVKYHGGRPYFADPVEENDFFF